MQSQILMLLFWIITSLGAVGVAIYLYLTWNFNYWRKRGLRTAEPLTIFGSIPNIVTSKRNFIFDIHDIYEKYKDNNRAVGIFVTRKPKILLLHPKLIHDVLVTNFKQFHDTLTSSWIDDRKKDTLVVRNPFWCAGEEWKQRRSEAAPGLTQNRIKQSHPIWESSCLRLRNYLEEKLSSKNGLIETKDIAYRFTADAMSDFIWGIDSGVLSRSQETNMFINMTKKWTQYVFEMLSYYMLMTVAPALRYLRPQRFFPKQTDLFFLRLQQDAIEMRQKSPNPDRPDFLNHLLQLRERKGITLDDFAGHSLTVLLDGYETSAVVLMHAINFLALNPQVQQKLRSEIQNAMKEENGTVSFEKLSSLPYLDQCVYETLRLSSVIPMFSRICTEPTTLEIAEGKILEIPVGMITIIPTYSIHLDEQYYPEPNLYKPERFDGGVHVEFTKQGLLLPFGDGPRVCLGMRVGLINLKSALIEIFTHYEVSKSALTTSGDAMNSKSFALTLDGDIWLEYKKL